MTAPEPPELWWSPSLQAEDPTDGRGGLYWTYRTDKGFVTPEHRRSDAVRLVPENDGLLLQAETALTTASDVLVRIHRLLDRCDEIERRNPQVPQTLVVDEVRALLGVPAPTKENRDA